MSSFYQRGIHKASLFKSMNSGSLKRLLNIVREDDNYVVLLRDDYFPKSMQKKETVTKSN